MFIRGHNSFPRILYLLVIAIFPLLNGGQRIAEMWAQVQSVDHEITKSDAAKKNTKSAKKNTKCTKAITIGILCFLRSFCAFCVPSLAGDFAIY